MSALWAAEPRWRESGRASRRTHQPSLRALPRPLPRLARVPFILVLIAVFGLGMTGLLMLNTTLQNQAFAASTLNRQATEFAYSQADLKTQIDTLAAPQELARRASALGLRPNPHPAFLVLPQGKIVGKPRPVSGNEVLTLVIKTPAELAADRAAAAARQQALAAKRVADAKKTAAAKKPAGANKPVAAKKEHQSSNTSGGRG
ncbi:MAG: hypothetical protein H0T91_12370 [Propionibacteriaceae bacterium]|nr:hypothetical protein [Propionibacteriaceae bacterium]